MAIIVGAVLAAHLTHEIEIRRANAKGQVAPVQFLWSYVLLIIGYAVLFSAAYLAYGAITLLQYVPSLDPVVFVLPWFVLAALFLAFGLFKVRSVLSAVRPTTAGGGGA
jgi:hypothetical protein